MSPSGGRKAPEKISQSEQDWAFAKRALARGDSEKSVVEAIASHRRDEKHNPRYYAELTVRKAAQSLSAGNHDAHVHDEGPSR